MSNFGAMDPLKASWGRYKENFGGWTLMPIVYMVVNWVASMFFILQLVIAGPLTTGFFNYYSNATRNAQDTGLGNLFNGFKGGRFGKSFVAYWVCFIFVFLWSLLFFIPGIIAACRYAFTFFIIHDHPELSGNEARKKSIELTNGHKWKIFIYMVVGYLGFFLFGIGALVTIPLAVGAVADLYERVRYH